MDNLIKCESCKMLVNPNQVKIYDRTIKPGIQARLWKCPHCNRKHLVTVMDKVARRMMQSIKEDRQKMGNISKMARNQQGRGVLNKTQARHNIERVEKLEEKIKEKTKTLDKRMKDLIDEYKEEM